MVEQKEKGFEYRDWTLGNRVIYNKEECTIVGLDIDEKLRDFIAVDKNITGENKYNHNISTATAYDLKYCTTGKNEYSFVSPGEITLKEKYVKETPKNTEELLVLQYQEVFDGDFIARIIYQDEEIFPRGEFRDEELKIYSSSLPKYNYDTDGKVLFILGNKSGTNSINNLIFIPREDIEEFKERIRLLNEKYSIKALNEEIEKEVENIKNNRVKEALLKMLQGR